MSTRTRSYLEDAVMFHVLVCPSHNHIIYSDPDYADDHQDPSSLIAFGVSTQIFVVLCYNNEADVVASLDQLCDNGKLNYESFSPDTPEYQEVLTLVKK